jgi:hypothetical protein
MAPGNQFMQGFGQGAGLIGQGRGLLQQGLGNILGTQGQIYAADASRPDLFGTIVGAGLGTYFSDTRLKDNIEKVGVDATTGLNLYQFNYKDDPDTRWQGVMASEVEAQYPAAVMTNRSGYRMVNYDALGIRMVKV